MRGLGKGSAEAPIALALWLCLAGQALGCHLLSPFGESSAGEPALDRSGLDQLALDGPRSDRSSPQDLLADNFSDGLLGSAWSCWRMQFEEKDGRLQVVSAKRPGFDYGQSGNGRGAEVVTHIGDKSWTDYRLQLEIEALGAGSFDPHKGSYPDCLRAFSILFRMQQDSESWNSPARTRYVLSVVTRTCNIYTRGDYSLSRSHNWYCDQPAGYCNPGLPLTSARSLTQGNSSAILDGPNKIAIEVKGDRIRAHANGTLFLDYKDDQAGYDPGFSAITYGGIGAEWAWETLGWIDDVKVTTLP